MVKKHRKSKRQSLHHKHKIEKKVREHHRQIRRDARKNPNARPKLKKDPGIPNLYPFKEELMHKMEQQQLKMDEEKLRQRKARQLESTKRRSLESMASDARIRSSEFDMKNTDKEEMEEEKKANVWYLKDGSKRAYYKEFKKIVDTADVILEVLDARDPLGCRCRDIEQKIMAKDANKKIILVLNKIDLVPRENVEKWLKFLRNDFPAIAFKCSTQDTNISQSKVSTDLATSNLLKSAECLGADTLVQLLKNYCRNKNLKTSISVGIIGFPNVGKSSLINSLKRTKAVGVGSTPGFTKKVQEVHLDKNIKLLDCPGIVFTKSVSENDIILRNAVKVEQIPDPVSPVESILKRCKKEKICELYSCADFKTVNEFLIQIANKRGKLKKGGAADMEATARTILQDWNNGKIPFFTEPPVRESALLEASVVKGWGKEFDLDQIIQDETVTLKTAQFMDNGNFMSMVPGQEMETADMEDDDQEEVAPAEVEGEENQQDEDDQDAMVDEEDAVPLPLPSQTKVKYPKAKPSVFNAADVLNPQFNKNLKKDQKKAKKKANKQKSEDNAMTDEPYNFNTDYWEEKDEEAEEVGLDDV